jgi:hypothetical protein
MVLIFCSYIKEGTKKCKEFLNFMWVSEKIGLVLKIMVHF